MKAVDFDLSKDLQFDLETGITTFRDNRIVLFDAGAIGLLRQNLLDQLGWDRARDFFLKFGFHNGYADFLQMKINYEFENEMELLASGPVIHTWEGIVKATPREISFDREKGEIFFTGTWLNSYEAEQHLMFNDTASEPVCWSVMGYASGWISAFLGTKVIAIEPVCVGKGDETCEWLARQVSAWDPGEVRPYLEAYQGFDIG